MSLRGVPMGCLIIGCIICVLVAFAYWWVPGWVVFWIGLAIVLAVLATGINRRKRA